MAAITRRTWADLLTEAKRRAGGIDYAASGSNPSFATRLQLALYESYLYLALRYNHFEMHKLDSTKSTSTTANTIDVPTDLYVPILTVLRSGTTYKATLSADSFYNLQREYRTSAQGLPAKMARFGSKFYFDRLPDAVYTVDIYYYKIPTAPDFAGAASPETAWEFDEYLLQATLSRVFPMIFRADLGEINRQALAQYLSEDVRDHLAAAPLADRREMENVMRPLGGAQA